METKPKPTRPSPMMAGPAKRKPNEQLFAVAPIDPGKPPWYKRKYLVYPQFQLTLIIFHSLMTLVLFALMVFLVIKSHIYLETLIHQSRLPAQNLFIQLLNQQLHTLLVYMVVATGIALFVAGIALLLLSHKLSGPMIKLRVFFTRIEKSGEFPDELSFRKNDFFQDLPETINKALKALKKKCK